MTATASTTERAALGAPPLDTLVARAPERRRAPLYHAAALILTAAARSRYRVQALGPAAARLEPSTLLVANHPQEADPAVAVAALYPRLYRPWRKELLVHFTLRDDLHARGFLAGYPLRLPLLARRLLFPIGLARVLDGPLPCPALRSAHRMLVVDLLRAEPDAELDELLPAELVHRLHARASELGRPAPRRARDALAGVYADLLWWVVRAEDVAGSLAENLFAERSAAARADFRRFVEIIRGGGVVLISPEGRSSPDGSLQPLKAGVGALVRIARPRVVQPLGIAYDPLVRGRSRAYVGVGAAVPPPRRNADAFVRALLAHTVPLTVGQVVAAALADGEGRTAAERLAREVDRAAAERRPVPPELHDPAVRALRVAEALAAARARPERLPRLLAAYRSARGR
ncbi:MAG TPA: hypothetical protein VFL60_01415 [Gaiellaceae bacterium]|nr:hypothetical protein [Gaiellaceae bacterium]